MSGLNSVENHNAALAASPYAVVNASVYVIDDDVEMRRSLHTLLSTVGVTSWSFSCASDFLDNLKSLEPAPILLDVRMPQIDGIQLITLLLERGIGWPIIVMTAHGEIPIAVAAMKLGAVEFLEKPFGFEQLNFAMQVAFEKISVFLRQNSIRKDALQRFGSLSPRETEVIRILTNGTPNKVAAHALSLSPRTVEMHRGNALAKLRVKSLAEVVHLANEAGLEFNSLAKDNDNVGI
ncbi:response regulator transcription factor [Sphingorhabdus sp.]|uniref:response regulator transcription factor n=1 Tax=Sphingorhabdus sp. TaxID=1902408 RepID=UPI003982EED8